MDNRLFANRLWAMEPGRLEALLENAPTMADMGEELEPAEIEVSQFGNVAIIPIVGTIMKYADIWCALFGGVSAVEIGQKLQEALDNPDVERILLWIDSPGGFIDGTVDLAEQIKNADKPITAYISDLGASAAYWIASQCDEIYCNRAGFVGSIGVYSPMYDTSKAYENAGVSVRLVKCGANKGIGVDGLPITDEQLAVVQKGIDAVYNLFCSDVAEGRGYEPNEIKAIATGETWIASDALGMGLIDGIATVEELVASYVGGETMKANVKGFTGKVGGMTVQNGIVVSAKEIATAVDAANACVTACDAVSVNHDGDEAYASVVASATACKGACQMFVADASEANKQTAMDACDTCASACSKFDDEDCTLCASACVLCSDLCEKEAGTPSDKPAEPTDQPTDVPADPAAQPTEQANQTPAPSASNPAATTLTEILAAVQNDKAFACDCVLKGMNAQQAAIEYAKVQADELKRVKSENETLKMKRNSDGPNPAAIATPAKATKSDDDFKAAWEANENGCRQRFSQFRYFKAYMQYENRNK